MSYRLMLAIVGSLVLLVVLVLSLPKGEQPAAEPLVIYCAVSNKSVLEAMCDDYAKAYGTPPVVQYGPSQTLLASIEVSRTGDLYLPADDSYLDMAEDKQLIGERFPLAVMEAVVAVPKGNPKGIKGLSDLLRDDVRLAQASPDATAIGKLTRLTFTQSGQWEKLDAHTNAYLTTIAEVANSVKVGSADAGIVFDAVLHDYPALEAVTLPELAGADAQVTLAVLATTAQPARARHLARYFSASDRGLLRYREFGFQPASGVPWKE